MRKSMLVAALAVLTVTLASGAAWAQQVVVCAPACALEKAKVLSNGHAGGGSTGGSGGPVIVR